MAIQLDYTNMMSDTIGAEYGLDEKNLRSLVTQAAHIHNDIMNRRAHGAFPFYDLPQNYHEQNAILSFASHIQDKFENLIVLGIGGSALGTSAIFNALRPGHNLKSRSERNGIPRLFVLDNVDPDSMASCFSFCLPEETCFLVISKSGSTVETTAQFLIARAWIEKAVGSSYREHFVMITDPHKGALRALADSQGYRSFTIPEGVGGRFSVFTPVGLLPLAVVGIDITALLKGAADFSHPLCEEDIRKNPAYLNAALQYLAYQKGLKISVLMPYSEKLKGLVDWVRQLWAESLGKKYGLDGSVCHIGPTPVNAVGTTDQHSQVQLYMEGPFDKVLTFLTVDEFDQKLLIPGYSNAPSMNYLADHSLAELIHVEQKATAAALVKNRRSNCTITIPKLTPETLGELIFMFEVQTLFAGFLFGVNPLDQPGVEEGKQFTYALMGRDGYEEKAAEYKLITTSPLPRVLVCE